MSNIKKKDKYKKSENMSIRLTVQEKEKIEMTHLREALSYRTMNTNKIRGEH